MDPRRDIDEDVLGRMIDAAQLLPGEEREDVLAGTRFLATKRADLLQRPVIIHLDGLFVFLTFTWWPFKPRYSDEYRSAIEGIRRRAFAGAASDTSLLDRTVPGSTLLLNFEGLHRIMEGGNPFDLVRPVS